MVMAQLIASAWVALRLSPAPAAPPKLMGALTVMSLAAFSVSVVPAVQLSGAATVILPACAPLLPVDTMTLAPDSAFWNVAALMTLSSPLAVKPD